MDIREGNRLNAVISFFIGLIIMIYLIPVFFGYSSYNLSYVYPYFYLFLGLLFLAIALFLYSYFMIRPVSTLKGRKILVIGAMSFGLVLMVFPLIGIGIILSSLPDVSSISLLYLWFIILIPFIVLLITGIIFFMHGWYLRKNLRSETIS